MMMDGHIDKNGQDRQADSSIPQKYRGVGGFNSFPHSPHFSQT